MIAAPWLTHSIVCDYISRNLAKCIGLNKTPEQTYIFSSPELKVLRVSYYDRPVSVVRHRPSCVVRQLFYFNIFSSETAHWILIKLHRNGSSVSPTNVVQMVLIGYISSSRGQKIGFQNAILKKSSCLKLQDPELSYLVYSIV